MSNEERFKNIIKLAQDMAKNVTNDLDGVATGVLGLQKMLTETLIICKDQEQRLKKLEEIAHWHEDDTIYQHNKITEG